MNLNSNAVFHLRLVPHRTLLCVYIQYICTAHESSLKVSRAGSANVRSRLNSNGARTQQQRDESDVQRK